MKNSDFEDIRVSTKHVKLRIVLFILAALVAVGAIAYGVTGLGRREPGYYRIEVNADEELIRLDRGVDFEYVFKGSKSEINAEMRQLQALYGASLRRCSRLLDAENTYTGVVNLAEINLNPGRELALSEELFAVLRDALALSEEGKGYSLFAGPLYAEWNSLLILADPQPFDPAADAEEAARISTLASLVNDPESISLEIVDEESRTVRLVVSDALMAQLRAYELDCPLLDLNLLHDAFLLRLIAADLEAQGYTNGYLSAASGVTVSLSGHSGGEYNLYGFDGEYREITSTFPVEAGTAFSLLRAFALEEENYGYYTVETDDGTLFRHPNVPATGEDPGVLLSCGVYCADMDPVRAVYESLLLFACENSAAVETCAAALPDAAVWTRQGEGQRVYANAAAKAVLREADYGWTIE